MGPFDGPRCERTEGRLSSVGLGAAQRCFEISELSGCCKSTRAAQTSECQGCRVRCVRANIVNGSGCGAATRSQRVLDQSEDSEPRVGVVKGRKSDGQGSFVE